MIAYFGYGSNIHAKGMAAKNIAVLFSRKASLSNWELRFNVRHWFPHEGNMANIVPQPKAQVLGGLHFIDEHDLAQLDLMESNGVGYQRILLPVVTDDGATYDAYCYVGMPAYLVSDQPPSRRYLNIIVQGAQAMELDASYIDALSATPTMPPPSLPVFQPAVEASRVFELHDLENTKQLTALGGFVFDMSKARPDLEVVKPVFAGKDITQWLSRRHDKSTGHETSDDYVNGQLHPEVYAYINAYLHAFYREFQLVGRFPSTHLANQLLINSIL